MKIGVRTFARSREIPCGDLALDEVPGGAVMATLLADLLDRAGGFHGGRVGVMPVRRFTPHDRG
ncbi:MAG: hypothetical protein LLF90_12485 [Methanomicrobiaceae archaeon]|uniref:hypothetical protein n=1 Tax=Methanoculleus sp. TaxID=90427 RepID=UPI00320CA4FD|nr:hypothetical protein [Methanomicrobiaceae archaeon]